MNLRSLASAELRMYALVSRWHVLDEKTKLCSQMWHCNVFSNRVCVMRHYDVGDDCSINEDAFWKMELAFVFGKNAKRKGVHFDCQGEIGQYPLNLFQ